MTEINKLREILNPSIRISKICLSYVERLFPEFNGSSCIILHKRSSESNYNVIESETIVNDEPYELDVTGSPLKYSFNEVNFDDTIITVKKNWKKEEERYLPLTRTEACNALNICLESVVTSCLIIALCDSKDNKQTRLLGTMIQGEWFITLEACSLGIETLTAIKNSSSLIQEHQKLSSMTKHEVTISAFNTFELFGIKQEMIDWKEHYLSNFEGSLSIEVQTPSLALDAPTRTSKNTLVMEVVTGSNDSPLQDLWKQLLLLNQYLMIMEEYKMDLKAQYNSMPLKFPDSFVSPFKEEHNKIMENLQLLLNGDNSYENVENNELYETNFGTEETVDSNIKIVQYIENLSSRHNLDFTDYLWELLMKNENYFQITKCIHTVLEEIITGGCLTQINFTNTTRFAKIISNPQEKVITHLLSGSLPLEYVIDMGFQKLSSDYAYILTNTRFIEMQEIQQKFANLANGGFNVEAYRKKLLFMAQIHLCLEFMHLIQNNLGYPTDILRPLFMSAFKQFVCDESPMHSHNNLNKNIIYSLTAPVPISMLNDMNKEIPSTRRISLSSQSKSSKLTTTRYYSQIPIFPTNIYPPDESESLDKIYHVINAICWSKKLK